MTALSALSSATLVIGAPGRASVRTSPLPSLTSLAAGITGGTTAQPASQSIFSVNHVDVNKLKINLMERVGKAFGLDLDDFDNAGQMARAIRPAFQRMELAQVMAMEKSLGLDKLGISLGSVLDAMEEPGGKADDDLDAALREEVGDLLDARETGQGLDEIGLYTPASMHR